MNDLRYSVRALLRMRGVAIVTIAALALGIAATTTMFSAAYAALLRPLPFADPDRLVLLFTTHTDPREGFVTTRWSRPLIDTLVASVKSYESVASFTPSLVAVSGRGGDPEQIDAEIVSPDYFATLRVSSGELSRKFAASAISYAATVDAARTVALWPTSSSAEISPKIAPSSITRATTTSP